MPYTRANNGDLFFCLLGSTLHHPSSVWASLIILSCPIIIVYGLGDPGYRAICSDSIDAEIRGCRLAGHRDTHVRWQIWRRLPWLNFTSGQPARSDGGRKMKGDAKSCSTDRKLTTSWFPCCFPTASTNIINNPPYPPWTSHTILSHFLHFTLSPFLCLHLKFCTYSGGSCLLNQWFRASCNGKLIKTATACSRH